MGKCIDCGKESKMERCYDCFKKVQAAHGQADQKYCECGAVLLNPVEKKNNRCAPCWRAAKQNNNLYALRTILDEIAFEQTSKRLTWIKGDGDNPGRYEMKVEK